MGAARERSEFDIKPPLGAPLLHFPPGYLMKSIPEGNTSERQKEFEIRVLPLPGELPSLTQLFASYTSELPT